MRSNVKAVTVYWVVVLLSVLGFARERNPNADILTANPIYHKNCAKCHGKNAESRLFSHAPSLVSDKTAALSAEDLRAIIVNGKGEMPKFGGNISAVDLDALIQQIKAANQK